MTYHSVFVTEQLAARARARTEPWAARLREMIVEHAGPWASLSDQTLWELPFSPEMPRAWQVWSWGHCPDCRGELPEYSWRIDALRRPWKVQCPHCQRSYPTNDFEAYYRSGIAANGEFDPQAADQALLFNTEHPDPQAPLHRWGVDDGWGFVDGDRCWRFIAAYLIYGQWKQRTIGGITALADAFVVTGDRNYARQCAILLDRVADLYPRMNYAEQGYVYETRNHRGYVSVWHDACEETRALVLAYDEIRPGLQDNHELVRFLSAQAAKRRLPAAKDSVAAIQRNIEAGLLQHPLDHAVRVQTNFPRQLTLTATIQAILSWPTARADVIDSMVEILQAATAVDGTTGEKGLPGYCAYALHGLACFIEQFARIEPALLPELLTRCPALRQSWRFHVDTWCLQKYYPSCGDGGGFARPITTYAGVSFPAPGGPKDVRRATSNLGPSVYSFLWRLWSATNQAAYAQVMFLANGRSVDGLPYDLLGPPAAALQHALKQVIDKHGDAPDVGSVDKQDWHLAILRAGRGDHARAAWLDYDSGRNHCHFDALNVGLFAHGLDFLPDYGYPPTGYGGHETPEAMWYVRTAAHNTVVVNQRDQDGKQWGAADVRAGRTTLWAEHQSCRAIRVDARDVYDECSQYERTLLLVDVSDRLFYLFDVFRVVGGKDHAKFTQSHYGEISTEGLSLAPQPDEAFSEHCQLRHFRADACPGPSWSVEWRVSDRLQLLPAGADLRFQYVDLSTSVTAGCCESWVATGDYNCKDAVWIPKVISRRQADSAAAEPLASTFVAVMQAYRHGAPAVISASRLPLRNAHGQPADDSHVCVACQLSDGGRDVIFARNPERRDDGALYVADLDMQLTSELTLVRLRAGARQVCDLG